jgi:eukaryotic-like serine/threonine-protein kinase
VTIAPGTRLGSYEITGRLGEGGMGEVFRATDSKLKREVAIKVLPAAFTEDPERLARFEREAQLLAQLHHPNIASIFGLEESDGVRALVMELVEGPTLDERMKAGALSLEECLSIARQIAEALEEAHSKGIVHRDLKPQNVKAPVDGKVKVLDFGLAKAMDPPGASSAADLARSPTIMNSPTMTAAHGTQLGVILGTAAYMSPEQARGGAVDKRADIWAFGVVLFEMLSGRSLFASDTVSDTLAGVLKTEVDFSTLPETTPPALRQLLRRCLERSPKSRLHDIADARLVLDDLIAGRSDDAGAAAALDVPVRRWKAVALWSLAALVAGLALGRLLPARSGSGAGESPISFERLTYRRGHFVNARFAPDGQTAFLAAAWEGKPQEIVQVRPGGGELPIGLGGTEILSVSRSGELALLLPRIASGNRYVTVGTLAVVSASGGTPRELAENVVAADWAPDGKSLAVQRIVDGRERLEFPLGTVLYSGPGRIYGPRVSPTGDAVAFFESEASGPISVVLVDRSGARRVLSDGWGDWWNLAFSPDGREVWFGGARAGSAASLYAVDREGKLRVLLTAPGTLEVHDVAPDRRVLVAQVDSRAFVFGRGRGDTVDRDLSWLESSSATALSADGRQILLAVDSELESGGPAAFVRAMDGSAAVRLGSGQPQELSRDGKWALAVRGGSVVAIPTAAGEEKVLATAFPTGAAARWMPDGGHVLVLARGKDGKGVANVMGFDGAPPRTVSEDFELREGSRRNRSLSPVSPDGRFVAAAVARGRVEVLALESGTAQPVPGTGVNDLPIQWTPDGRQLYVLDLGALPGKIWKVDLATGRRDIWREIQPVDRVGVSGVTMALVTPDGSSWAYSYPQFRSSLYLVKGLR